MSEIEAWTAEDIERAYKNHGTNDDWGVKSFYVNGLLAALRGEYDDDNLRLLLLRKAAEYDCRDPGAFTQDVLEHLAAEEP